MKPSNESATSREALELAALLVATPETLGALLQLPPGAYIDGITAPIENPGTLLLRVRGAGWPMVPGRVIPMAMGHVTRQRHIDGHELVPLVDWKLPT